MSGNGNRSPHGQAGWLHDAFRGAGRLADARKATVAGALAIIPNRVDGGFPQENSRLALRQKRSENCRID